MVKGRHIGLGGKLPQTAPPWIRHWSSDCRFVLQARASEGILKILAKTGCFLSFEWEKTNLTTLSPP